MNIFSRSISRKILAGYLVVALLVAVVATLELRATNALNGKLSEFHSRTLPVIKSLEDLKFAGLRIISSTSEFGFILAESEGLNLPEGEDGSGENEEDLLGSGAASYSDALTRYETLVKTYFPEEASSLDDIRATGQALQDTSAELVELKQKGVSGVEVLEMKEELEAHEVAFLRAVDRTLERESEESAAQIVATESALTNTTRLIAGAALVTFIGVILAGSWFSSKITSPVRALTRRSDEIAQGNLDVRLDELYGPDEVGQLAKSFGLMLNRLNDVFVDLTKSNKRLERSNQELQEFASIAAHDLQEPLRKVEAFGDRLQVKCGDQLSDQGRDYLSRMQNAAGRMRSLIEDLLSFSRVTSKGEAFTPVDLHKVTQEVLSDLEIRIEQVGGRVEVDDLPTIDADPTQMRQLFQNLIGNSLKFHRPEEPPVIKIHGQNLNGHSNSINGSDLNDELYEIVVEDNGIGFEEEYLDSIFTIFQRLHGLGEYEGNGVGLAVCRKIAERHGGNITAKGIEGEGAKFIITLPKTHMSEVNAE